MECGRLITNYYGNILVGDPNFTDVFGSKSQNIILCSCTNWNGSATAPNAPILLTGWQWHRNTIYKAALSLYQPGDDNRVFSDFIVRENVFASPPCSKQFDGGVRGNWNHRSGWILDYNGYDSSSGWGRCYN